MENPANGSGTEPASAFQPSTPAPIGQEVSTQSDPQIADAISTLNNDLSASIEQLSSALTSSPPSLGGDVFTSFLFAVVVAIVGAFSAYLFNLFHWKMVEKKRKVSRISGELSSLIEDLETIAVKYWVQDYSAKYKEDIYATEVTLKSKLRLITHLTRVFSPVLEKCKEKLIIINLDDFQIEIFDLVTGDDFESTGRKASKPRAMKISSRCSDIRAKIASLDSRN